MHQAAKLCSTCGQLEKYLIYTPVMDYDEFDATHELPHGTPTKLELLQPEVCELCALLHMRFAEDPNFDPNNAGIDLHCCAIFQRSWAPHCTVLFEKGDETLKRRIALVPTTPTTLRIDADGPTWILSGLAAIYRLLHGRISRQTFHGRKVPPLLDNTQVEGWVQTCQKLHRQCKPLYFSKDFDFNMRLIDVQNGCVVDAPKGCSYLALSYVWGKIRPVSLKRSSEALLKSPGSITHEGLNLSSSVTPELRKELEELCIPRTILNAIELCKRLGERYLWVDCLTILQDDDFKTQDGMWTNADKQSQLPRMHEIYGGSALVIIAASGENSEAGLPGILETQSRGMQLVGTIGGQEYVSVSDDLLKSLKDSMWSNRAWTFQEWLFSKRHLIFLPDKVVYHCCESIWVEDYALEHIHRGLNAEGRIFGHYDEKFVQLPSGKSNAPLGKLSAQFFKEHYMNWVTEYLQRRTTLESEILVAFHGVTSLVEEKVGKLHYGLPTQSFGRCLCWSQRHMKKSPVPRRRSTCPSWSWAGWVWEPDEFKHNWSDMLVFPSYIGFLGVQPHSSAKEGFRLFEICNAMPDLLSQIHEFPDSAFLQSGDLASRVMRDPKLVQRISSQPYPAHCLVASTMGADMPVARKPDEYGYYNVVETSRGRTYSGMLDRPSAVRLDGEWRESKPDVLHFVMIGREGKSVICYLVDQVEGAMERVAITEVYYVLWTQVEWKPEIVVIR
ncbi:HET-domain-containing protein [Hyaloscypha variabilis F]|uniref:HET-domain-containing protein n=1 Tax=Hyaloscypha variabilis (strain UAMH 11265 / GT02V1 / F) TaxID=1149755 RepID=A0A2J6RS08_HYAVF|nr:HET-domain-containing protein [Hyaloscypha variabilis F]